MQSGVDKIRLTGGEPLIRKDVEDVLRGLRRVRLAASATSLSELPYRTLGYHRVP